QFRLGSPARGARVEELPRLALEAADLPEDLVDLVALPLELLAPRGERGDEFPELRPLVGRRIVELEHLPHVGEREPEALAAQDGLQAHKVALGVDAAAAVAARREQSLVLVETDRARRDVELAGEIADRALVVDRFGGVGRHNLREFAP